MSSKKFVSITLIITMILTNTMASFADSDINIGGAISALEETGSENFYQNIDDDLSSMSKIVDEELSESQSDEPEESDKDFVVEIENSDITTDNTISSSSTATDIEDVLSTEEFTEEPADKIDDEITDGSTSIPASFSYINNATPSENEMINEEVLFGDLYGDVSNYVFGPNWFDPDIASLSSINDVCDITFLKSSDATPSNVDATWNLPSSSNGLKGYTKKNHIYIYAPNDVPILMADNSEGLFQFFRQVEHINNFDYLDTENVTNMKNMFLLCENLTSINFSNFNTKNVTDMSGMFSDCKSIEKLDLSLFNTNFVTKMINMFANCTKLTTILATTSFTSGSTGDNPDNWAGIFNNCSKLTGGAGTRWSQANSSNIDYVRIDRGPIEPGYFTSTVPVPDIKISTFSIISSPSILTYKAGTCFNPAGLKIRLEYTNGKLEDVIYNNKTNASFSFNPSLGTPLTKSNQRVYISYAGIVSSVDIKVLELTGIKLLSSPSKLSYYTDDRINPNGLTIECYYVDLHNVVSTESVTYNKNTKTHFSFSPALNKDLTLSDRLVTVTYGAFNVTYNITVQKGKDKSNTGGKNTGTTGGSNNNGGSAGPAAGSIPNPNIQNNINPLSNNLPINKSRFGMLAIINSNPLIDVVPVAGGKYLHQNGEKITGLNKVRVNNEDAYYYFKEDSTLYSGWMKDENNNLHYFGEDGKMMANKSVSINGFECSFNGNGDLDLTKLTADLKYAILANCNINLNSGIVNYEPTTNTWRVQVVNPITNEKEFAKGLTTLVQDDGINTYYFDASGIMQVGYQYVNGSLMYFDPLTGKKVNNV